jgi:hypothetical protein
MSIAKVHLEVLLKAVQKIGNEEDVAVYCELKRLLASDSRDEFKAKFTRYYALNSSGLTNEFKQQYFELLFNFKGHDFEDPHTPILLELYKIKRRKGDRALQFSFVSKLVAIYDESWPLFDKFVSEFFGLGPPAYGSPAFRIAGFVTNLKCIRERYNSWAADPDFSKLTKPLFQRLPQLKDCHKNRVCDFLVWTAGKYVSQ